MLNGLAGTTQRAQTEIARLESTRRDLQSRTEARQAAVAQAQERADTLAILAGLVPVTGPGIRITITDGERAGRHRHDARHGRRSCGPRAPRRSRSTTRCGWWRRRAFEDAAGGMVVDGTLLQPPYVIDVIGDPHTLAGAHVVPQRAHATSFEDDGATVKVDELALARHRPACTTPQRPRVRPARPAQ